MAETSVKVDPGERGTAIEIALDKIGSIFYPIYKLAFGGDGVRTLVSSSDPLPVLTTTGKGDMINDTWGVPKVSLPISVFHGLWTFNIPSSMWFMYENNVQVYSSTNITSTDGHAGLVTSATKTTLLLEGRECPRYQPNRGHLFSNAVYCPLRTADGVREWGLGTAENKIIFRLKSDGLLYAVRVSGSVEKAEELIDTSSLTGFDVEKNNIYDIQFQWRSAGNYRFFVGDPSTGYCKLVHEMRLLGTLLEPSVQNPAMPVYIKAQRVTEDVSMHLGCADITSENGAEDENQYGSSYAENASVNGTDIPVMVVKVPLQINSNTNTRTMMLARISLVCGKKATFKVWISRDPTAITGATFKKIIGETFLETDSTDNDSSAVRATASDDTKMQFIRAVRVQANVNESIDNPHKGKIKFTLVRGDYLIVTCTASSTTADCDIEWGEEI